MNLGVFVHGANEYDVYTFYQTTMTGQIIIKTDDNGNREYEIVEEDSETIETEQTSEHWINQ